MPRQASYTYRGPPTLTMEPFISTEASCHLYLNGPPINKRGPPVRTEWRPITKRRASYNHRGASYIYRGTFYIYRGPPMPTESLLRSQRVLSAYRGRPTETAPIGVTYRESPLPTEGPPIPRWDSNVHKGSLYYWCIIVTEGLVYLQRGLLCIKRGLPCLQRGFCTCRGPLLATQGPPLLTEGLLYLLSGLLYLKTGLLCSQRTSFAYRGPH